jgi:hypothetical protein
MVVLFKLIWVGCGILIGKTEARESAICERSLPSQSSSTADGFQSLRPFEAICHHQINGSYANLTFGFAGKSSSHGRNVFHPK